MTDAHNSHQCLTRRRIGVALRGSLRVFSLRVFSPSIFIPVCALLTANLIFAQTSKPTEYAVKAAYLYNFGKFVKWPAGYTANQGAAFEICVLGDDPFGVTLQSAVAGKNLGGLPVAVRHIAKPQDAASCRVLFIDGDQESHLKGILTALDRDSVLTVSDISDFSKRGGMIEFVMEGDRVRFAINRSIAESAGLTLEADLLKVATTVRDSARQGGP